jgi:YD repeat-containing protein
MRAFFFAQFLQEHYGQNNTIMPKRYFHLTILFFSLLACEKDATKDLGIEKPIEPNKECKILSNTRSDGQQYQFVFKENTLQNIIGFNDFDTFIYTAGKLSRAVHSRTKNAYTLFEYNDKNQLSKITFEGIDSQGKKFSYPTVITYNNIGKIDKLVLNWPTFPDKVDTRFTYDANGNVKYITAFLNGEWETILENTEFDDKPSPYKNQKIGNILSYYMVYSLLSGGLNFTQYINTNNVKTAVVKRGFENITYRYEYQYNTLGFPTKVDYTRTLNNRPTPMSENFSYDCEL